MPKSRVIHNPYASKKRPRSEVANTPLEKAPPSAPASSSASLPQPAPASSSSNDSSTASRTSKTAGALIISAAGKAGIPTNLRADIDRIILRESQGSLYLQQQEKRDAKVNAKIQNLKTQLIQQEESASGDWKRKLEQEIEPFLSESIQNRPNRSTCVVVDCDAFYWSCAALSLPKSYEQLPCVVGGSMILTSNYAARKYGVRSAMAGWIADKLVEELSQGREKLIHVKSDYALYKEKSKQVVSVLREYDANLKAYSLDEAYMNLGPYLACALQNHHHHHHPDVSTHEQIQQALGQESSYSKDYVTILERYSSEQCCQALEGIVAQMRAQVTEATQGLTVSAGIAPNHMLAKIASDYNKPNGQTMVPPEHDSVKSFLYPLPTRKVSGIGRVTEKMLQQFGISTVQELYDKRALVKFLFQPATANFLLRVSVGCSSSSSWSGGEDDGDEEESGSNGQKGISRERTFTPESSWKELCKKLDHVADMLSEDMQGKDLWARTITVKVKLHTYDTMSKCRSLSAGLFVQAKDDLLQIAQDLFQEIRNDYDRDSKFSLRLLGIRCSNFRSPSDRNAKGASQQTKIDVSTLVPGASWSPTRVFAGPVHSSPKRQRHNRNSIDRYTKPVIDNSITAKSDPSTIPRIQQSHQQEQETAAALSTVPCPICGRMFQVDDNDGLNQHIDSCLSCRAVKEVLREVNHQQQHRQSQPSSSSQQQSALGDFFLPKRMKR